MLDVTTKSYRTAVWHHVDNYSPEQIDEILAGKAIVHPVVKRSLQKENKRPKLRIFKDHVFLTLFVIGNEFNLHEVNFLAGKDWVTSFTRESLPMFSDTQEVVQREQGNRGSTGHVLYHLADELAENHLGAVDRLSKEIQKIQMQVFDNPFTNDIGHRIFNWRNTIHNLRSCVEEEIEVLRKLVRADLPYIDKESGFYLQDLEDDLSRVLNGLGSFQEQLLGIIDLQTSLKADQMNTIMKTLTLVSVLFIPISFITGIYGTNFPYVPELKWKYSYFGYWAVVLMVGICTITYFKKRKWW